MHCTRCDYPLWNLKDRRCPECGQDFAPSQFSFVPRSVKFCCPHCEQHYFGTGVDGHLVPRVFDCVTCGQHIHMDEMVLLPAEGLTTAQTRRGTNPWIDEQRKGFFGSWFRTIGRGMVAPSGLIDQTPAASSTSRAMLFALATALANTVTNGIAVGGFAMATGVIFGGRGTGGVFGLGFLVVFGLVATAGWLLIWTLVAHLLLVITGKTEGKFRRTVQCMSYSSAPNILVAIPCLGFYAWPVAAIWQAISATIMIKRAQKVSGLRAAFAALVPPLIAGACMVAFVVWMFTASMRAVAAARVTMAGTAATSLQGLRCQSVASSLDGLAQSNGAYPSHAIELLKSGLISSSDLTLSSNPLAGGSIIVGSTTLGQIEGLQGSRRESAIDAFVQSQPSGVVAHRIGDFVFTYHGMTPGTSDRGLWVFIAESPPAPSSSPGAAAPATQPGWMSGPSPQATGMYFVGCVGGTTQTITQANFASALAAQNQLRADFQLPPIPDPSTVTPASPAMAPK